MRMSKSVALVATLMAGFLLFAQAAGADAVLDAMKAELDRSKTLSVSGFESPYFVSFAVYDYQDFGFEAEFGGIQSEYDNQKRRGHVEVRVGDYAFDNSGKGGLADSWDPGVDLDRSNMNLLLPIDDDIDAIRAQLWLVTDTRYKIAVADYLRKKGKKVYLIESESQVNDFSKEKPTSFIGPDLDWEVDLEHWKGIAKSASALFKQYPTFTTGHVSVVFSTRKRRLVNTEKTEIVDSVRSFSLRIQAGTRAEDGQKLFNFKSFYARSKNSLPDEASIMQSVKKVADDLVLLSKADKIGPYSGPAILDPSLAGVFFHEAVGHRLEGERQEDTDEGQTFKGKVGEKVLPEFISLYDDPTLETFGGQELNGHYRYDDEGVMATRLELVKNGVMKTYLMSRAPIEGVGQSNGHGRSDGTNDPMARMGNTLVVSNKTAKAAQLKKKLMQIARKQGKPFALILKQGRGGETATGRYNFQAFKNSPMLIYKVDATTGAETLVRGVEVVGTPLVSLNKLVVSGDDPEIFNGYCGAESGWVPVSVVAPSLLVSEIELQRTLDKPIRSPILPPPF